MRWCDEAAAPVLLEQGMLTAKAPRATRDAFAAALGHRNDCKMRFCDLIPETFSAPAPRPATKPVTKPTGVNTKKPTGVNTKKPTGGNTQKPTGGNTKKPTGGNTKKPIKAVNPVRRSSVITSPSTTLTPSTEASSFSSSSSSSSSSSASSSRKPRHDHHFHFHYTAATLLETAMDRAKGVIRSRSHPRRVITSSRDDCIERRPFCDEARANQDCVSRPLPYCEDKPLNLLELEAEKSRSTTQAVGKGGRGTRSLGKSSRGTRETTLQCAADEEVVWVDETQAAPALLELDAEKSPRGTRAVGKGGRGTRAVGKGGRGTRAVGKGGRGTRDSADISGVGKGGRGTRDSADISGVGKGGRGTRDSADISGVGKGGRGTRPAVSPVSSSVTIAVGKNGRRARVPKCVKKCAADEVALFVELASAAHGHGVRTHGRDVRCVKKCATDEVAVFLETGAVTAGHGWRDTKRGFKCVKQCAPGQVQVFSELEVAAHGFVELSAAAHGHGLRTSRDFTCVDAPQCAADEVAVLSAQQGHKCVKKCGADEVQVFALLEVNGHGVRTSTAASRDFKCVKHACAADEYPVFAELAADAVHTQAATGHGVRVSRTNVKCAKKCAPGMMPAFFPARVG